MSLAPARREGRHTCDGIGKDALGVENAYAAGQPFSQENPAVGQEGKAPGRREIVDQGRDPIRRGGVVRRPGLPGE